MPSGSCKCQVVNPENRGMDIYPFLPQGRIWLKVETVRRGRLHKSQDSRATGHRFTSTESQVQIGHCLSLIQSAMWIYVCLWFTSTKGQMQCESLLVIHSALPARMPEDWEGGYLSVPPTRQDLTQGLFYSGDIGKGEVVQEPKLIRCCQCWS